MKNILFLFKNEKKEVLLIFLSTIAVAIITTFLPLINRDLIDHGLVMGDIQRIVILTISIFVLNSINQLFEYIQFLGSNKMNNKIHYRLYYKAYKKVLRMNVLEFSKRNYNQIVRQYELDINNIQKLTESYIIRIFTDCLKIVGAIIGLSTISIKLTLLVIIFIPIKIVITNIYSKINEKYVQFWLDCEKDFSFWLGDSLSGITEIKLWNLYGRKIYELKDLKRKALKSQFKFVNISQLNLLIETLLHGFIYHIVLFICGSILVLKNEISIGGLFSFLSYTSLVLGPISYLVNVKMEIASVKPSMERYLDFIEQRDELSTSKGKTKNLPKFIKSIEFENVSLYIDQKPILQNISFKIDHGENIAIVGFNGSGKSSILSLLLRFYEPSEGRIKLNDVDIVEYRLDSYRLLFNFMSQKSYLFNDTIENNLSMYSDIDYHALTGICSQVGAIEFINKLDQGFAYRVGNDGTSLSGGEKQKLAVARTLLKEGRVLVLDEATSNFDHKSEILLEQSLLLNNIFDISIIITHKQALLSKVDKIFFIQDGELRLFGTYDNLLKNEEFRKFLGTTDY